MVFILDRIFERHPELSRHDVEVAWDNAACHMPRLDGRPFECMAIGFDTHGRAVEMIGRRNQAGDWVVYHAFTPPTRKALREMGLGR